MKYSLHCSHLCLYHGAIGMCKIYRLYDVWCNQFWISHNMCDQFCCALFYCGYITSQLRQCVCPYPVSFISVAQVLEKNHWNGIVAILTAFLAVIASEIVQLKFKFLLQPVMKISSNDDIFISMTLWWYMPQILSDDAQPLNVSEDDLCCIHVGLLSLKHFGQS